MKALREAAAALGLEFFPGRSGLEIVVTLDRLDDFLAKEDGQRLASVMEMLPGSEVDFGAARGFWNGHEVLLGPDLTEQGMVVGLLFSPPLTLGLRMYREGFLGRVGKMLGAQDVEVGHPELDRLVMVKASSPEGVRALFARPSAQTALLTLFESWPAAVVNDVGVRAVVGKDLLALVLAMGRVAEGLK